MEYEGGGRERGGDWVCRGVWGVGRLGVWGRKGLGGLDGWGGLGWNFKDF